MFALAHLGRAAPSAGPGPRPDGAEAALLRRDSPAAAWPSAPSPRRCCPPGRRPAARPGRASPATCSTSTSRPRARSGEGSASCRAATSWSGSRGSIRVDRYWSPPAADARVGDPAVRGGRRAVLGRRSARPSAGIGGRTCRSGVFLSGGRRLVERRRGALRAGAGRRASTRSRSASRTRASTRAATPAPSPSSWAPTTTSGPSRLEQCLRAAAGGRRLARRAVRRRLDPADPPAEPVRPRVGDRRPRGRRRRRAAGRLPDLRGRARRQAVPAAAAAGPGAGRGGRRPAAGRPPQLQPRLQAQAVPPGRRRAVAPGPPALARARSPARSWPGCSSSHGLDVEAEHLAIAEALAAGRRPADPIARCSTRRRICPRTS